MPLLLASLVGISVRQFLRASPDQRSLATSAGAVRGFRGTVTKEDIKSNTELHVSIVFCRVSVRTSVTLQSTSMDTLLFALSRPDVLQISTHVWPCQLLNAPIVATREVRRL